MMNLQMPRESRQTDDIPECFLPSWSLSEPMPDFFPDGEPLNQACIYLRMSRQARQASLQTGRWFFSLARAARTTWRNVLCCGSGWGETREIYRDGWRFRKKFVLFRDN
ncbi:MAG: hypothetical protein NC911_04105 [Candidatus Omnitrophica bacterium]|nr:hypothetical protein [Candidatus Omnitrophota bacterium]